MQISLLGRAHTQLMDEFPVSAKQIRVKKFETKIQMGGDEDEELTLVASTEQRHLTCPILQDDMIDPVRNEYVDKLQYTIDSI